LANGAPFWKALATINEGLLLAVDGNETDAIKMFTSGMAAYQSTGATLYRPQHLSYLRVPMRKSANLRRLGAALAKR
jgi:hypothetical protein